MGGSAKLTKEFLLKITNQFDLESIYTISLVDQGVYDLGCIGFCSGLVCLKLSGNKISKLTALSPLKQLQILDLSRNRISSLDGLESLESLNMLNLAGNLLNSTDALYPLKQCEKLEHLRLESSVEGDSNPVLDNDKNYKARVWAMLPGLKTLNGLTQGPEASKFNTECERFNGAVKDVERKLLSFQGCGEASTIDACIDFDYSLPLPSGKVDQARLSYQDTITAFKAAATHAERVLQQYGS